MGTNNARERAELCPAVRRDGQPCRARPGTDEFCIGHTPSAAEARRKGGLATSKAARASKLMPSRLRPVAALLENALEEVYSGSLEPRKATAMASIAGALVRVMTSGELEERVRALEGRTEP